LITEKIILGIDPGTTIMGYGIIKQTSNKISFVCMDVLKLDKFSDQPIKLKKIFETCLELLEKYHPDALAIEAPFYGKNVQSMLKLGRAQGVAMAAGLYRSVPIFEYSPKKIKQSITGNGNASKEQVAAMLQKLLNLKEMPVHLDATDGLAAAVCYFFQRDIGGEEDSKLTGWKSFIAKNPEKVIKKPL
jgi:crossover junction endodeoxyribonuclease RuvC